ncbi:28S ribosomal protein S10, mitochondrial-like [Mercenaria mercenaria]|uniref:28S ribosomal protein S10, mitochondrial-like n=1 Tax=Mercenaria mercenaria TaxID=6596 RepID=UPI00234F8F06|nr:28S ribosomal protein S10, mitochondrial-like [Mercenaria mercenaria]
MAASLTKTLPKTLNLISCRLSAARIACCCNITPLLSQQDSEVLSHARRPARHLVTYSQLRQHDVIKPETSVVEPVAESVPEEDEPDVLYKKIMVEMKGHDQKVLQSYETFVKLACKHLEIRIGRISKPKVDYDRISVQKSVHIFKKHYTQLETRTHFLVFEIPKLTGSTADTLLEYIQRNLPEGVAMKVTRHGIEKFPEHLVPPTEKTEKQLDTS